MRKLIFLFPLLAACVLEPTPTTDDAPTPLAPAKSELAHEVDVDKELFVRDSWLIGDQDPDARPSERIPDDWRFSSRFRALGAASVDGFFEGFQAPYAYTSVEATTPTIPLLRHALSVPFLVSWRAAGGCYGCDAGPLPLDQAPFVLVGIVNRVDQAEDPCSPEGGELRFVYNAFDAKTRRPVPFSVIFEYRVPREAATWARAFHALGSLHRPDDYRARLLALTSMVTTDPANLKTVRTNEKVFSGDWRLREFRVRGGQLVPVALAETPDISFNQTSELDALFAQRVKLGAGTPNPVPMMMMTGEASTPSADFRWESSTYAGGASTGSNAGPYSQRTCNGCHGGNRPDRDRLPFQHVSFGAAYYGSIDGEPQVSDYLSKTELPKRKDWLSAAIQVDCTQPHAAYKSAAGGLRAAH